MVNPKKPKTRVTIMLDKDLSVLLHSIQAKQIETTSESISFSEVVNDVLRSVLVKLGVKN